MRLRSGLFFIILMVNLACSLHSSLKKQYEAERLYYKASKYYAKIMINPRIASFSDYKSAISAYEALLNSYPENTNSQVIENLKKQSLIRISELWLLQGDIHAAIKAYEKFIQLYPDDKTLGLIVHYANAKSNERIFNLNKALGEYETLVKNFDLIQDPMKPQVNFFSLPLQLARLKKTNQFLKQSNGSKSYYDQALSYYDSVATKWPNTTAGFLALYYKSSIYADLKQWHKTIQLLNELIDRFPDRDEIPNIMLTLGNVYLDGLNNTSKALSIFEKILKKYPDNKIIGFVHFAKARAFLKEKRFEKGRKLLRWVIQQFSRNESLCAAAQLAIATSYEIQGDWERALVEYRWVQEKYPLTFEGFFVPTYIAERYRSKGLKELANNAYEEAIKHYTKLIKKYPKSRLAETAQEYIVYCLMAQEKWEKATQAAISLRRIQPGSRSEISSYLFLGQIYERLNDFEEAIKIYEKFSEAYPDHPMTAQIKEKIKKLRLRI